MAPKAIIQMLLLKLSAAWDANQVDPFTLFAGLSKQKNNWPKTQL